MYIAIVYTGRLPKFSDLHCIQCLKIDLDEKMNMKNNCQI